MTKKDHHLIEQKTASEEILRGNFLHAFRDTVRLPDGASTTREYIVHPGAVMVLAFLAAAFIDVMPVGGWSTEIVAVPGPTPKHSPLLPTTFGHWATAVLLELNVTASVTNLSMPSL